MQFMPAFSILSYLIISYNFQSKRLETITLSQYITHYINYTFECNMPDNGKQHLY